MALTAVVDECCRDDRGQPTPPMPRLRRGRIVADATLTRLAPSDVPSLASLGLTRGKAMDTSRAHPFSENYTASAAVCALWDGHTDERALLEWLDHHRCAWRRWQSMARVRGCQRSVAEVTELWFPRVCNPITAMPASRLPCLADVAMESGV